MKAAYTRSEIEALLTARGILVYEHLHEATMTAAFFRKYNQAVPAYPMAAPKGVHYIFAVKKG